jgi:predicted DNA repair protein MutK
MKLLSIVGTAAMFLVGGGIITHGIPAIHHAIESATAGMGGFVGGVASTFADGLIGVATGAAVLAFVALAQRVFSTRAVKT